MVTKKPRKKQNLKIKPNPNKHTKLSLLPT